MPLNTDQWSTIDARILRDLGQSATINTQSAATDRRDWFNQGMLLLAEVGCFEAVHDFTCDDVTTEFTLPTDFILPQSYLWIEDANSNRYEMYWRPYAYIKRDLQRRTGGRPLYGALFNYKFAVYPEAPATGYTVKMPYYRTVKAVADSTVVAVDEEAVRRVESFVRSKVRRRERNHQEAEQEMAEFGAFLQAQAEAFAQRQMPDVDVVPQVW